jgi:CBS domain containing-hemolysin-like protein
MMEENKERPKKKTKKEIKERQRRRWVLLVTLGTFLSTLVFSYISDTVLSSTGLILAFVILLLIILIGIFADILGIAVASVSLDPFNAMAAKKIKGAKTCVNLVKNASRVSSVCNDVIGDICGIVSGATSVSIVAQLLVQYPVLNATLVGLLSSAAVACLTVGGKAIGKDFAMANSTKIIHTIAIPIASVKIMFKGQE